MRFVFDFRKTNNKKRPTRGYLLKVTPCNKVTDKKRPLVHAWSRLSCQSEEVG